MLISLCYNKITSNKAYTSFKEVITLAIDKTKKKVITIPFDIELIEIIKSGAKSENRSMNNYIQNLVLKDLQNKNLL